jgi:hypothetical protein
MNSVLTRNEIEADFSLLAWRGLRIAAAPGVVVHVKSGVLRVRTGRGSAPRIVSAGAVFAAAHAGVVELKAYAHAELRIEWPDAGSERLSPGLEPITWPAERPHRAMEPIARSLRP